MKLLTVCFMLIAMTNCSSLEQHTTRVRLEGGEIPNFILSGGGTLSDFIVYGPRQRPGGDGRAYIVWEIQPTKNAPEGQLLKKIGSIKYGVVPDGYKQIYPKDGSPPPPLASGIRYAYWAQITNAPHAREEFELIDGKATEIPGNK